MADNGMVLPIEAYKFNIEEGLAVDRGLDAIVTACLADKGFDYRAPKRFGQAYRPLVFRRYAFVSDLQTAEQFGYKLPVPREQLGLERDMEEPPGEAVLTALMGNVGATEMSTPGGCTGKAFAQMSTGEGFYELLALEPIDELEVSSYFASRDDSRVVQAFKAWSACMADAGYHYDDPLDDRLIGDSDPSDGQPPSREDIQRAITDVRCQQKTGVTQTWFEVESEIQQRMLDEQAQVFAQIKENHEKLLRKANEILAGLE